MMNRLWKSICASVLMSLASVSVSAAERTNGLITVGGSAGMGVVTHGGDDADNQWAHAMNKLGLAAGAAASLQLARQFALQTEIMIVTRGSGVGMDGERQGAYSLTYIDVPLLARFQPSRAGRWRPYVMSGLRMGFRINAAVRGSSGRVVDLTEHTRLLDVGLAAGAGVAIVVSSRDWLTFEARYDHGLTSISDNDFKNRALLFLVGYHVELSLGRRAPRATAPGLAPDTPHGAARSMPH